MLQRCDLQGFVKELNNFSNFVSKGQKFNVLRMKSVGDGSILSEYVVAVYNTLDVISVKMLPRETNQ